ncbi:hypothetical protein, partial [Porphyromonas sp.]|uniref:hypothetical protein n=1 Tax=Porphyromonas sp. TaxID=1924944 RepID=UPI00257D1BEB
SIVLMKKKAPSRSGFSSCIDEEKPLREGAFFFMRTILFPSLDKRSTRDKAKGLLGHFREAYRGAGCVKP